MDDSLNFGSGVLHRHVRRLCQYVDVRGAAAQDRQCSE